MKNKKTLFPLGFKGKLILMVAAVTTVSLIASNWFSFNLAKEQVEETIYKEIDRSLSVEINEIEQDVQRTISVVNSTAAELKAANFEVENQALMHYAAKLGGIDKMVIGFDDGRVLLLHALPNPSQTVLVFLKSTTQRLVLGINKRKPALGSLLATCSLLRVRKHQWLE